MARVLLPNKIEKTEEALRKNVKNEGIEKKTIFLDLDRRILIVFSSYFLKKQSKRGFFLFLLWVISHYPVNGVTSCRAKGEKRENFFSLVPFFIIFRFFFNGFNRSISWIIDGNKASGIWTVFFISFSSPLEISIYLVFMRAERIFSFIFRNDFWSFFLRRDWCSYDVRRCCWQTLEGRKRLPSHSIRLLIEADVVIRWSMTSSEEKSFECSIIISPAANSSQPPPSFHGVLSVGWLPHNDASYREMIASRLAKGVFFSFGSSSDRAKHSIAWRRWKEMAISVRSNVLYHVPHNTTN